MVPDQPSAHASNSVSPLLRGAAKVIGENYGAIALPDWDIELSKASKMAGEQVWEPGGDLLRGLLITVHTLQVAFKSNAGLPKPAKVCACID